MKFDQANPFPTDNRLRDDIGLAPLAELGPPVQLIPYTPAYFPSDDRLRDDVGLPPLGAGADIHGAAHSLSRSTTRRLALSGATLLRAVEGYATAVTAILRRAPAARGAGTAASSR